MRMSAVSCQPTRSRPRGGLRCRPRCSKFTIILGLSTIVIILLGVINILLLRDETTWRRKTIQEDPRMFWPNDPNLVPNIAHWIIKGGEISFFQFLSLKSIRKFMNPDVLLVHADEPYSLRGQWWDEAVATLNITLRASPTNIADIGGFPVKYGAHKSDFIRLLALMNYGGLYIDTDVWLLKSIEPLRKYPITLGSEDSQRALPNAAILAHPQSVFLRRWYDRYLTDYQPRKWGFNSVLTPAELAKKFPNEIHVEKTSWMRPNWAERQLLFVDNIDLSDKYMIHLWHKADVWGDQTNLNCPSVGCTEGISPESLKTDRSSTVLTAARRIFYD
eukprot:939055_1